MQNVCILTYFTPSEFLVRFIREILEDVHLYFVLCVSGRTSGLSEVFTTSFQVCADVKP